MTREKRDIYQEVTDKIVTLMEQGARAEDWVMPWTGVNAGLPFNAVTGKTYRGINVPLLWCQASAAGHETNQWASYKQWLERGAQVRKGEKGTMIVFYRAIERKDADGEPDTIRFLRYSTVFNAAQVDGYEPPVVELPDLAERIEACDDFASNSGADIRYGGGRAFYTSRGDYIALPAWDRFRDTKHSTATENAYSTLFHELTHWTGHKDRCGRDLANRFGSEAYAAEELVAELGAAFICAHLGITSEPREDHAQYLDSWLRVLRSDKKAIFTAASQASQALDYLEGLQYQDEPAQPALPAPAPALPTPAPMPAVKPLIIGGVQVTPRWPWSKWYEQSVRAQDRELNKRPGTAAIRDHDRAEAYRARQAERDGKVNGHPTH